MVWMTHPESDNDCRRLMITQIMHIFEEGIVPTPNNSNDKVELARRLEVALYKASKSKEEYMKSQDLKHRVEDLLRVEQLASTSSNSHNDVLRQRQERLLLLRHASKCTIADGSCPTKHCAPMQKLWKHLNKCEDQNCKTPHCVSSRYVLSHYHRCQDKTCEVCQPVREKAQAAKLVQQQQQQQRAAAAAAAQALTVPLEPVPSPEKKQHAGEAIDPRFARGAKDGAGPSLPLSMTREDLVSHVHSLNVEQIQEALFPPLRKLMEHKSNLGLFNQPVDPVAQNIPDYPNIIKHPMDLGTIRRKLDEGLYRTFRDFELDVKLVFDNATKFNPEGNPVHDIALSLSREFERDMNKVREKMQGSKAQRGRDEKNCTLCGYETCERCILCDRGCLSFEPKVLYCCGPCRGRVERQKHYYQPSGSSLIWCQDCYDASTRQPGGFLVDTSTGIKYSRQEMTRRRNEELIGEPWVHCDSCKGWVHQICALFNTRKNDSATAAERYCCPKCLLKDQQLALPCAPKVPGCADLEQTHLGSFLERWVRSKLEEAFASDTTTRLSEPPPPSSVFIRILSNYEESLKIKPFGQRLLGLPEAIPYRSRAIFLFQKLDGVDVLLFVMYVQEYDSKAPLPNRGKTYIAYLDSVHFFRPRQHRTLVYHELLLAYLEYSRRNGYTSCYIWACPPPTKRDDYVIHCHPPNQRVPSPERLRKWYHDMIRRGTGDGIVLASCSLFEEHYEETTAKLKNRSKSHKKQVPANTGGPAKSMATKPVVRSETPKEDDEDNLLDGLAVFDAPELPEVAPVAATASNNDDKPLVLGLRAGDAEMTPVDWERRRNNLFALRKHLPYFDGDYWPSEVEDLAADMARKHAWPKTQAKRPLDEETDQDIIARGGHSVVDIDAMLKRLGETLDAMRDDFLVVKLAHECSRCGVYLLGRRHECRHRDCVLASGFNRPTPFALCDACYELEASRPLAQQHGGGCVPPAAAECVSNLPATAEFGLGCTRLRLPTTANHALVLVDEGVGFETTPQWDKDFRNPLLETRHAFLSLCTGNRYAFNELRRAKHTTQMILYHLHNPDAPAHLYTCNECQNDIIVGNRYHCHVCQNGDFDLCHACAIKGKHQHKLTPIEVTRGVDVEQAESQREQMLAEKRRSRQKSLLVFLRALVHASSCKDPDCSESACKKMMQLLQHRTQCTLRVRGGCEVCRRVLCLVQMHARECTETECAVPHCEDLKKHLKQQADEQARNGGGRKREADGPPPNGDGLKIKLKLGGGGDGSKGPKRPKVDGE